VPVIGNRWGNCDPDNPKNRRTRPSILIETNDKAILVDTSPDIRSQLLDNDIKHIDAVLFTHLHYDHIGGIGELRTLSVLAQRRIDIYGTAFTVGTLESNWDYLFARDDGGDSGLYQPVAEPHTFDYGVPFEAQGIEIMPFRMDHGICDTAGFRIRDFAYSTDVVSLDDDAFEKLEGVDTWVVDCLRQDPHPTHAHFDRTLEWIDRVKPRRAVFTHMNFQTDYEATEAMCPDSVEPGYDGMVLEVV
jgi:phosphoribosyl 1,2-cyclic phosphate phosphodiesterase